MWYCETALTKLPIHIGIEVYGLIMQYKGKLRYRHDGYRIPRANLAAVFLANKLGMHFPNHD